LYAAYSQARNRSVRVVFRYDEAFIASRLDYMRQITHLDYAKELTRWSSSDLQREVSRRLRRDGNPLLELMRDADPLLDEVRFNDALTANLRRGRFLLLIVGDGIREGVETIAEYLQAHAGLHFSLGLIEMPIYLMPDGDRLVVPRVFARTMMVRLPRIGGHLC
jgi:hypothetical protein